MKNKLGKLTFGILCSFLVVYVFYNIYSAVRYYKMMDAMNTIFHLFNEDELFGEIYAGTSSQIFSMLIGPVICWLVALIYTVTIGSGKRVNRVVYIITALAVLSNLIFSYFNVGSILSIVFLLIVFAAFVSIILLCVLHKNLKMKKTMNITLIFVYGCAVFYEVINCIIKMLNLFVFSNRVGLSNLVDTMLYCGMIFVSLIVAGLVLGYVLFPEKYMSVEEQSEL